MGIHIGERRLLSGLPPQKILLPVQPKFVAPRNPRIMNSSSTTNGTTTTNSNGLSNLYLYHPSLAAAVVFTVLFAVTGFLHLYQMVRIRTWYLIPLTVGGFCACPKSFFFNSSLVIVLTVDPRPS